MTTIATNTWEINGVVDTSQSVTANLTKLANASGCYLTWDSAAGTWSVVINDVGNSVFSFNNSNVIGNVSVSGSGISELYNSVIIEFPHKDVRDSIDYVNLQLPSSELYAQELDNELTITTDIVNDPLQAALIASRELKQSRLDNTIVFKGDFTANGLQAGDLIDVTNDIYDYNQKVFRIIEIVEEDGDDGSLTFQITAAEYSADVYSASGLERTERSKSTGIVPSTSNQVIVESIAEETANNIGTLSATQGAASMLSYLNGGQSGAGIPFVTVTSADVATAAVQTAFRQFAGTPTQYLDGHNNGNSTIGITVTLEVKEDVSYLIANVLPPSALFDYYVLRNGFTTVTGDVRMSTDIADATEELRTNFPGWAPVLIEYFDENNNYVASWDSSWQNTNVQMLITGAKAGTHRFVIRPDLGYDLQAPFYGAIYPFNYRIFDNANGAGFSFYATGFQL